MTNRKTTLAMTVIAASLLVPAAAQAKHGSKKDIRGEVTAVDASSQTLMVQAAARDRDRSLRSRRSFSGTVEVDVSDARLKVADVDGDGRRTVADFAEGDAVRVKLSKRAGEMLRRAAESEADAEPVLVRAKEVRNLTNPRQSGDDGTPDQGRGDRDDNPSGDDDGTPDQGRGDRDDRGRGRGSDDD